MLLGDLGDNALYIAFAKSGVRLNRACDGLIEIEALLGSRAHSRCECHELCYGRHLIPYAHEDIVQRIWIESIFGCSACHDSIDLAVLVEVADIRTTAVGSECVKHDVGRYTCPVALCSVDVHLIFGEGLGVERHCHLHLRVLLQFGKEGIDDLVELRHIATLQIFHLQIDSVTVAISGDLRHLEGEDLSILDILAGVIQLSHDHVDVVFESLTLVPRFEPDDECTITDSGTGEQSEAGYLGVTLDLLESQHMFLDLRHYLVGFDER